jgi:hypothetical protein
VEEPPSEGAGRLRVLTGPLQGRVVSLGKRINAIGRASDPILAIARGGARCFVMRIGGWDRCEHLTVNGIIVGSRARPLRDGDVIEVGSVRFAYLAPAAGHKPPEAS